MSPCWNVQTLTLDLSSIDVNWGSSVDANMSFANKAVVTQVAHVITQHCSIATALAMRYCYLGSLSVLMPLIAALPALENLSLQHCGITSLDELRHLSGWTQLKELVFTDNPAVQLIPHPAVYHHRVKSIFPQLRLLDQQEVMSSVIHFGPHVALPCTLFPASGPYVDPGLVASGFHASVQNFMTQYFAMFDEDRNQLIDAYSSTGAVFSLAAPPGVLLANAHAGGPDGHDGHRGGGSGVHAPYHAINHNLQRPHGHGQGHGHGHRQPQHGALPLSKLAILETLRTLPVTRHQGTAISMDLVPIQVHGKIDLMQVVLRGSFLEGASGQHSRRFTRTMLLGQQETPAWPMAIKHDQLTLGASNHAGGGGGGGGAPRSPAPRGAGGDYAAAAAAAAAGHVEIRQGPNGPYAALPAMGPLDFGFSMGAPAAAAAAAGPVRRERRSRGR